MARHRKNGTGRFKKEPEHCINNQIIREIIGNDVKLVNDAGEPEVMSISEALRLADDSELDLILVGAKATPPVVKMIDYSKFLYEKNKKKPQQKSKDMKEIRFRPNTDSNDLNFKTNHIINFLKKGHKVKALVSFKGREMTFKDKGEKLLLELAVALNEHATVEAMPKLDGRKMYVMFKPKEVIKNKI